MFRPKGPIISYNSRRGNTCLVEIPEELMPVQSKKIDVEKSKDSAPDSFSKKTPNYIDVMNLLNSKEKNF